ncbi:hypothetical protein IMSAGC013_03296 [Lachnospiraceae bacterium]|nr:hypothetical protein IMSAGC013_03296 [Lachnospiraceae bacterium]
MQQSFWMVCFEHMFICFACIHAYMMFFHFCLRRYEMIFSGNGIRQLFPSLGAEFRFQFLLGQIMVNPSDRKPGKISLFLPLSLWLFWRFEFQSIRLCFIEIADCFGFIEKYNRSICFAKTDLACIFHFFGRPAKTALLTKNHLLHQKLHFFIRCVKFLC